MGSSNIADTIGYRVSNGRAGDKVAQLAVDSQREIGFDLKTRLYSGIENSSLLVRLMCNRGEEEEAPSLAVRSTHNSHKLSLPLSLSLPRYGEQLPKPSYRACE